MASRSYACENWSYMKKIQLVIICLIAALIVVPCAAMAELKVTFLDINGSGTVLVQADGQAALIDAMGQADAAEIFNALSGFGVSKIDLLAETTPFRGQPEDVRELLEKLAPSAIWLPKAVKENQAAPSLSSAIVPGSGHGLMIGGAKLIALPVSNVADTQAQAMALRIEYGQRTFLLLPPEQNIDSSSFLYDGEKKKVDVLSGNNGAYLTIMNTASPLWCVSADVPKAQGAAAKLDAEPIKLNPARDGAITFITDGSAIREEHKSGGITSQGSVNVRREASAASKRVATLKKGTLLTITGSAASGEGVWYEADIQGKSGFIRGDLVTALSREDLERLQSEAALNPSKKNSSSKPAKESGGQETPPADCH